jgi:glucose-1-phosphatase
VLIANDLQNTYTKVSSDCDVILFDLGKVLIPFEFGRAYQRIEALCGLPADDVRARLGATDLFRLFETGHIESRDFATQVGQLLGLPCNYQEFCEIWTSIFLPQPLVPDSLVASLRKDHRTFIVSNTNAIHFDMLRRTYPILGHFDGYVLSYEIHAMKPAPAFYAEALGRACCPPERCLFIDDMEENVLGARTAGMDAIQFCSREQLESELIVRGLLAQQPAVPQAGDFPGGNAIPGQ